MVPRWFTDVLDSSTPYCCTICPTSVMSPPVASMMPELTVVPRPVAAISVPSTVANRLPLVAPLADWVTL